MVVLIKYTCRCLIYDRFSSFSFQIKHACGNPSLIEKTVDGHNKLQNPRQLMSHQSNSWPSPIHTILIDFISSVDRAKNFFMRISDRYKIFDWWSIIFWNFYTIFIFIRNSLCEDYHTSQNNRQKCWDGSHLGEYSHDIIAFDQQKYNPAVKVPQTNDLVPSENSQLHILNDKLVNLRNVVMKSVRNFIV